MFLIVLDNACVCWAALLIGSQGPGDVNQARPQSESELLEELGEDGTVDAGSEAARAELDVEDLEESFEDWRRSESPAG